jgi:uncharacterized DUF497 family protein
MIGDRYGLPAGPPHSETEHTPDRQTPQRNILRPQCHFIGSPPWQSPDIACTLLLQAIVSDEEEFNWDDANVGHLARHGVSPFEAEEAILDPHAILLEIQTGDEERVKAVGATSGGRILVVVFTWRGETIPAITAYPPPVALHELYLEGEHT